tara:strand:- start:948 stop:1892 length:945 start_codon:yes stop_codon:yes gene_type:complete
MLDLDINITYKCINCGRENSSRNIHNVPYKIPKSQRIVNFEYIECQCGHVYLRNRPSIKSLQKLYSPKFNNYYSFSKTIGSVSAFFRNILLKKKARTYLKYLRGKHQYKIIDIGCGDCSLIFQFKKILGAKADISAVDIFPANSKVLQEKQINFYHGRIEDLDINNKFDLIICNQIIEHVADIDLFILSLKNISKQNGIIIFETPNTDSFDKYLFGKYWGGYHPPQHFEIFNENRLKEKFNQHKLNVIRVDYLTATWNWATSFSTMATHTRHKYFGFLGNLANPIALIFIVLLDTLLLSFSKKTSNMRLIICNK